MAAKGSSGKGSSAGKARSAITGRYVKTSTAARHPKTTVLERSGSKGSRKSK